jgi:hypothetical protein
MDKENDDGDGDDDNDSGASSSPRPFWSLSEELSWSDVEEENKRRCSFHMYFFSVVKYQGVDDCRMIRVWTFIFLLVLKVQVSPNDSK